MSAVSSLFHIVINTLRRELTIPDEESEQLYRYIWSIVQSRNCRLLRINGIGNHVHILVELSPTVCLSDLVRDKEKIINYIINQREHHRLKTFR